MLIRLFAIWGLLSCTLISQAQFKKGTRMAGANIGNIFFNAANSDVSFPNIQGYTSNTNGFGLSLTPSFGWFKSEKTAMGLSLNIAPSSSSTTYQAGGNTFQKDKISTFNIGVGGFARNYFNTSTSFMPYGQFSLNAGISSQSTSGFFIASSNTYKSTYTGKSSGGFFANASLAAGMTKLVSSHIGLDLFAGYNFSYNKNTYKTTTLRDDGNNGSIDQTLINEPTTKYTNHGFVLGIGFQIFLDPSK